MSNVEQSYGSFKEEEHNIFARVGKAAKFILSAPHVHVPNTGAAPMLDAALDIPVYESDMGDTVIAGYAEIADQLRFDV